MNIFRNALLAAALIAVPFSAVNATYHSNDGWSRYITVYNNSDYDVYRVKFAVPGGYYYTDDLLGSQVLDSGYNIRLLVDNGRGNCEYYVKAETRSGATKWEKLINVCRASSWSLSN